MIREFLLLLSWLAASIALASSLYTAGLTAAAAVARPRTRPPAPPAKPSSRFAILVPAHNEETVIERLLQSMHDLDYPADLLDIYVIADNCEDDTEALAQAAGARVLSRRDPERHGKGHALRWALQAIALAEYDAVVMVDADSVVDQEFLRAMDARLAAGAQAVQGYYGVLDARSTPSALRSASFALMHYVRPLGKSLFGGSCGLKGNGMAFSSTLLAEVGWRSFSVAEDAEQHIRLIEEGVVVEFAPEAKVWADMPSSLAGARSQNLRWEEGRWKVARHSSLSLLWRGLRRRSLVMVDAAVEPLIPPLSVVAALSVLAGLAGLFLGSTALLVAGGGSLAGLGAHVVGGLLLARAPLIVWRSLLVAPLYLIWKVALYVQALLGVGGGKWVRTPRSPADS